MKKKTLFKISTFFVVGEIIARTLVVPKARVVDEGMKCSFCEINEIQHLFLINNFIYESYGNHGTPQGHVL
ncbi:MAG: hypothetical protein JKZ03_00775 [Flavobacteriaceae bacterium]|nr:hypothetical protein [Flavobacteriaceae bacterium]